LPVIAEKGEAFLQVKPLLWEDARSLLTNHEIGRFEPLMTRIEL